MQNLLKKKRFVVGRIDHVLKALKVTDQLSTLDVDLYLNKLNQLAEEVDELFSDINNKCKDLEFEHYQEEYKQLEDKLHSSRVTLLACRLKQTPIPFPVHSPESKPCDIKLPKLELPTFDGKFHLWLSFRDLFVAAVHNNSSLSGAQKLQYLKTALTGEPELLIANITLTNANYEEAWQILNERYQNKREIVASLLDKILNQPVLQTEAASGLRSLADTSSESVRALRVLEVPVEQWDAILTHIVSKKLDSESRRQWELSLKTDSIPTFTELHKFIDQRARALAAAGVTTAVRSTQPPKPSKSPKVHHATTKSNCEYCNHEHSLYKCSEFRKLTPKERHQFAKGKLLCFNCLRANHTTNNCTSGNCQQCSGRHNTLLHFDSSTKSKPEVESGNSSVTSFSVNKLKTDNRIILATALIKVKDRAGRNVVLRALLDSASEASFITEHWVQQLKLDRVKINTPISGIGAAGVTNSQSAVNLNFSSLINNRYNFSVNALTLPKITGLLPSSNIHIDSWDHIKGIKLADPNFNKPSKIDVLLDADIFFTLLRSGRLEGPEESLGAQETVLGWILAGKIQQTAAAQIKVYHSMCNTDNILRQFWETEEVSVPVKLTPDEQRCEQHFASTFSRNEHGRYVVEFPFKHEQTSLGVSRDTALLRLKQTEKRLAKNPELRSQYVDFMHEYSQLQHMKLVPVDSISTQNSYYMPHHPVVKENSLTTKVRVVFDASHKSTNNLSLNDNLLVGPKLQPDLITILLRFRLHAVAITADIEKMYRQVMVSNKHVDYQRILWRDTPIESVQEYRLLTVTYGTTSAPYHAVRCFQQLAHDEGEHFPEAGPLVLDSFYVDDFLVSVKTTEEAIRIQQQLVELLQRAGFKLRKWASNDSQVLDAVNQDVSLEDVALKITPKSSIMTLGLEWRPREDQFIFNSIEQSSAKILTKRIMLSNIAKIFDPLGLLSPVTVRAKILLQSLWKSNLDWDEEVDVNTRREWEIYSKDLKNLNLIQIDRCITLSNCCQFEIHVFSDASEKAYAAAVYLRSITSIGDCKVSLVTSKTKVTPLNPISIPRLELCAALLASKLIKLVLTSLNLEVANIYAWTDSMVTLAWVTSHASRWKPFVAHRVQQIQENMPTAKWNHVPGEQNPADCASRGITVEELTTFELWRNGPRWLSGNEWPESSGHVKIEDLQQEERKVPVNVLHTNTTVDLSIIEKYSNLTKLTKIVALCFRFCNNAKAAAAARKQGFLTVEELNQALNRLILLVQEFEFNDELKCIKAGKPLSSKSRILPLNPYLDSNGLLRVGGRLQKA